MTSLSKSYSFSKILLRPIWVIVLVLFSFQIVSASLSTTQCHEQALHEHSSNGKTAMHDCGSHGSSEKEEHCNDLGFCLFGHCHVNHCTMVLQNSSVNNFAFIPESLLGLGTEEKLVSLLDLDKPWQPPRV